MCGLVVLTEYLLIFIFINGILIQGMIHKENEWNLKGDTLARLWLPGVTWCCTWAALAGTAGPEREVLIFHATV